MTSQEAQTTPWQARSGPGPQAEFFEVLPNFSLALACGRRPLARCRSQALEGSPRQGEGGVPGSAPSSIRYPDIVSPGRSALCVWSQRQQQPLPGLLQDPLHTCPRPPIGWGQGDLSCLWSLSCGRLGPGCLPLGPFSYMPYPGLSG